MSASELPVPRRALRLVRQMELGDCGAACLATVLRAHGQPADLAELRDLTSTGRDGVSALGILAAARHHGFDGQGVRCAPDRLADLPAGAVLHWAGNHFVALVGATRRGVQVLDPALGRRVVPESTFRQEYSGVALLPAPQEPAPRGAPGLRSCARSGSATGSSCRALGGRCWRLCCWLAWCRAMRWSTRWSCAGWSSRPTAARRWTPPRRCPRCCSGWPSRTCSPRSAGSCRCPRSNGSSMSA